MAIISRPTFKDIAGSVYPEFEEFYWKERTSGNRCLVFDNFQEFTTDILNEILLNAQSSEAVLKMSYDHTKQCNRKKKRWEQQFLKAIKHDLSSRDNPLYEVVLDYDMCSPGERKKKYGEKTREEVIEKFIDDLSMWAQTSVNEKSWFIKYPLIGRMTPRKRYDALREDIETCLYILIKEKFGGGMDISAAMQVYIKEMDQGPIFAPSKKKYRPDSDGILSIVPISESGKNEMVVTVGSEEVFRSNNLSGISVLDTKDQELFFYVMRRAAFQTGSLLASPELVIDTIDLAKVLSGSSGTGTGTRTTVSNRVYKDVEERIFKLVSLVYSLYRENKNGEREQYGAINFLSSAIRDEMGGRKVMRITLSPMVQDALLNGKLRMFPAEVYNRLTNPYAKVIFTKIQKDRIKAHTFALGVPDKCVISYTKSDMMRYINHQGLSRRAIIKEFRGAVNEFIDKEIFIKSAVYDAIGETLRVMFYPLSEDEVNDLNSMGFSEGEWLEKE